jgi:hypothetical protein
MTFAFVICSCLCVLFGGRLAWAAQRGQSRSSASLELAGGVFLVVGLVLLGTALQIRP